MTRAFALLLAALSVLFMAVAYLVCATDPGDRE